MSKNKVRIDVCGIECVLGTDDSEEYVRAVGEEVGKAMSSMMKQNDRLSVAAAAVFTALNYCDDARKAQAAADNLRSQIKNYVEDASRARMEADESRREIDRLNRELQTLRGRLAAGPEEEPQPQKQAAPAGQGAPADGSAPLRHAAQPAQGGYVKPDPHTPGPEEEKGFLRFFEKKDGGE